MNVITKDGTLPEKYVDVGDGIIVHRSSINGITYYDVYVVTDKPLNEACQLYHNIVKNDTYGWLGRLVTRAGFPGSTSVLEGSKAMAAYHNSLYTLARAYVYAAFSEDFS